MAASPRAVLALDQGTTSSRAILFDRAGRRLASAQQEFRQHFPRPGWVEHDPVEIWTGQMDCARRAMAQAGLAADDVAAVGITNQRETVVLWDRRTGVPVHPAIVWQDRRTADRCAAMLRAGLGPQVTAATGLVIDPYFSATKLAWLLENVEGARRRAEDGELAFGTIDTWLLWNLTGGRVHATEPSNASRTMLYNIHSGQWDTELLDAMQIPSSVLPEVMPTSGLFGTTDPRVLGGPLPVAGIAGDQQSALFGQACFEPGMAKCTYGTGCFLLMQTGDRCAPSRNGLLSTIAWQVGGLSAYALEGSVFVGGAAVQWLRDGLGIIGSSSEVEALAATVPDTGGVYFVPAFAGLGAPHWDACARGAIVGLTRGSHRGHIARAALDAIAYQVADVVDAMGADAGAPIVELRVDGGAAANNLLLQTQADLLGVRVVRPTCIETTALGAAFLAGLGVGFWTSPGEIAGAWAVDRVFEPAMPQSQARARRGRWCEAVARSRQWAEEGGAAK